MSFPVHDDRLCAVWTEIEDGTSDFLGCTCLCDSCLTEDGTCICSVCPACNGTEG